MTVGIEWIAQHADLGMVEIWTDPYNVRLEREVWCRVMEVQKELGRPIPEWAIRSSRQFAVAIPGDTASKIKGRELITRHDVKARLEVFCQQAGHEYHHLGMTSADIVDNCTQIRILRSGLLLQKLHGVSLPYLDRYTMRGIKGAVGTQQDQLDLLGSHEACLDLDRSIAHTFGFGGRTMTSTGQVYPRSQDLEALSEIMVALVSHSSIDRGWQGALAGFVAMAAAYSGGQWNEGDVSTSVVRRVCLPGAFLVASAGLKQGLV